MKPSLEKNSTTVEFWCIQVLTWEHRYILKLIFENTAQACIIHVELRRKVLRGVSKKVGGIAENHFEFLLKGIT